ncbi:FimB/Mfa2 family fimbrial subunit [Dysgonomonas massiliensis]|uniref:FimB/Mfa2 family fimbrial subunit n=1 Tax=Dysgonomonas massiliensis TaxID=2040292 RepID=UPI000C77C87A|nr:FimB/Mfa2 family fimbrial subunit [Dysgonomonas massiliensis]
MNRYNKRVYHPILMLFITLLGFSSCSIDEDIDNCGSTVSIRFDYSYNMLSSNAFGDQVDMVTLYVFDANGVLVKEEVVTGKFDNNSSVEITDIPAGSYKLVSWAKSSTLQNAESDFIIPKMTIGSSKLDDLSYYIQKLNGESKNEQNNFLVGLTDFSARGELSRENVTISYKKVTNKIKLVVLSKDGESLDADDYDFSITDKVGNGHINYNYELLSDEPITYLPYYTGNKLVSNESGIYPIESEEERYAAAAEFSLSRLIEKNNAHLKIKRKDSDKYIMQINIPEYVKLTSFEGNIERWSLQEYLDRQDEYSIVVYIQENKGTWLWATLVINGWVINNIEIEM